MRAAFIAAAGFLSAAVLVFAFSLGSSVTRHVRRDTIAKWTGHLWISADGDFEFDEAKAEEYGRQTEAARSYLAGLPPGCAAVPWSLSFCTVQVGTKRAHSQIQATDFGLDLPMREATELVSGAFPGDADEYGAIVSDAYAAKYGLEPGDSFTVFLPSVYGARNVMDFSVTGVFRSSAPWYDDMIGMRAIDYEGLTERAGLFPAYKVYVDDESRIGSIVDELAALVPDFKVKGYKDDAFIRFILSLGWTDVVLLGVMATIIFLALLIGINSILLTNVFDRRDEIGTLRALGFPKGTVRNLFLGEALVILLAGYLAGAGAVAGLAAYFKFNAVRPPLLVLQYMFGMTRMELDFNALTALGPFFILFGLLFLAAYRRVGIEAEKQAVVQMANR